MKKKVLLGLFALSYLALHFFTLDLNPLPWFDETFFASVAVNFAEQRNFVCEVTKEMWKGKEILYHGPVFYLLQSFSYKVFGFSILTFRWIPFVFGILTIVTTGILLKQVHSSQKLFLLLIITYALDPFMYLSLHEGRMDLVTIFFMLLSIILLLKGIKLEQDKFFIFSGLSAVTSLLTSPRVAVVYIALGIVFLISLEGKSLKSALGKIVLWLAPVVLLYYAWSIYAFGGLFGMYEYYQNLRATTAEYIGFNFYVPVHEKLLIAVTAVSIGYGIIKNGKEYFNKAVLIALLSIGLFYIIVFDYGPYSNLILPFYYFLLFHSLSDLRFSYKSFSLYAFILVFCFNLSFFSIKSLHIVSEKEIRNPQTADEFVKRNIPEGSRVIGDAQYYYSVIRSGSEYRLYDQLLGHEERERLLREGYDYDYMIVTERSKDINLEMIKYFLQQGTFRKVAELKTPESKLSQMIGQLGVVSTAESQGYNAEIYVRIKDRHKNPMALNADF